MAQKATKTLASSNTQRLNRTLVLTLTLHFLFWLTHLVHRRKRIPLYLMLTAPQLLTQLLFERQSRPAYHADGTTLKRAGEDLDAKGLTEYLWDVMYWTYGCLVLVCLFGDGAWWAWSVVPLYSVYAAWAAWRGVSGGFGAEQLQAAGGAGTGTSKRAAKMEKRGQRVQYR